jgi:hypothetical protein
MYSVKLSYIIEIFVKNIAWNTIFDLHLIFNIGLL